MESISLLSYLYLSLSRARSLKLIRQHLKKSREPAKILAGDKKFSGREDRQIMMNSSLLLFLESAGLILLLGCCVLSSSARAGVHYYDFIVCSCIKDARCWFFSFSNGLNFWEQNTCVPGFASSSGQCLSFPNGCFVFAFFWCNFWISKIKHSLICILDGCIYFRVLS